MGSFLVVCNKPFIDFVDWTYTIASNGASMLKFFNDLKISTKLTLSTLMFSLPILTLLFFLVKARNEAIEFGQKERKGNYYQRPLEKLLQNSIKFREVVYKKEQGIASAVQQLNELAQAADVIFKEILKVQDEVGEELQVNQVGLETRKRLQVHPQALLNAWNEIKGTPSEERLTQFIHDIRTLIIHLGDTSNMILDPDLDSYYLMDATLIALPQNQNRIGDILFWLRQNLQVQNSIDKKLYLIVAASQLKEGDLDRIQASIQTSLNEDRNFYGTLPSLHANLPDAFEDYNRELSAFIQSLRKLSEQFTGPLLTACLESGERALKASFNAWDIFSKEFDNLLECRINTLIQRRNHEIIITVVVLSIAIILVLLIEVSILNPIRKTIFLLKDIAQGEGDLSKRLKTEGEHNEINQLSFWFNVFIEKLQNMIKSIVQCTTNLTLTSQNLNANATQMAKAAHRMGQQTSTVASACKSLSKSVVSMSATANEISASSHNVASAIEEMSASVQEISKNCSQESEIASHADLQTQKTRQIITELGEVAQSIGQIVNLIGGVAEQTHLLALNATIEAAGAGDAGKGFAVVAGEVKTLANKSTEAAQQITKQIETIQSKIITSVTSIEEISAVIGHVNQISIAIAASVEEQSATVNEISKNISGVSLSANELAQNIQIVANDTTRVSVSTQRVNTDAQGVNGGTREAHNGIEQLLSIVGQLQAMVGQFKV